MSQSPEFHRGVYIPGADRGAQAAQDAAALVAYLDGGEGGLAGPLEPDRFHPTAVSDLLSDGFPSSRATLMILGAVGFGGSAVVWAALRWAGQQ